MSETQQDIPRWAEELGTDTWQRIGEMLDAGHRTMDIVRELKIPESKVRSLQLHVRKYGPRRRLQQFARFKDAVLSQIEEFGEELVRALSVTAALAVSNETKASVQVRALEVMSNFTNMLSRLMAEDAKTEEQRQRHEGTKGVKIDPAQAVRDLLAEYGVDVDGNK
jgi:predicted ATPase